MLSRTSIITWAGLFLAGLVLGWRIENWRMEARLSEVLEAQAKAVAAHIQAVRAEELRLQKEWENELSKTGERVRELEALVDSSAVESAGLRRDLERWRGKQLACSATPAGSGAGFESPDPIGVLIGMLEGMEGAGRGLAEYADRLKAAGELCEDLAGK